MKSTKNDYYWFIAGVIETCISAFAYGITNNPLTLAGAIMGFASYSMITVGIYRQRNRQKLIGDKSAKFLTKK